MNHIVAFEGLTMMGHVRNKLLSRLPGYGQKIYSHSFLSHGPTLKLEKHDRVIVIGHSMGGPTAIWYCHELLRQKISVHLLLTLDPRPLHQPYIKPVNVLQAINYYQRSWWMPGYPVDGAKNKLTTSGHTAIPAENAVLADLMAAIK